MPLTESANAQAIRELHEKKCPACGGPKSSGRAFCQPCQFKLPPRMRTALYHGFGSNYLDAYDEAKEYLKGL